MIVIQNTSCDEIFFLSDGFVIRKFPQGSLTKIRIENSKYQSFQWLITRIVIYLKTFYANTVYLNTSCSQSQEGPVRPRVKREELVP